MKKALVTGITGQDGSYLAELLLSKGYEVHGLIRRASTFNTQRIEHLYRDPHANGETVRFFLHYGDLANTGNLVDLIYSIHPDEVYHLAAQSHVRVSFDLPEYTGDVTGLGTVRILDENMGKDIVERVKKTAETIAAASGASAVVEFSEGNPITYNDPALTRRMEPSLRRIVPDRFDSNTDALTTAEDFAYYQRKIPGVYFFLGVAPKGSDPKKLEMNRSPRFNPDEGPMVVGVRALAGLAVDYLSGAGK